MIEIKTHPRGKEIYRTVRKKDINCIIIHHTWAFTIDQCVNHWLSNSCGTHYIIERDGTIYKMVEPQMKVHHCVGMNDSAIGIDLMRGKGQDITDEQYSSLNALVPYLAGVYNIGDIHLHQKGLFYHCDFRKTQCPKPIKDNRVYGFTGN